MAPPSAEPAEEKIVNTGSCVCGNVKYETTAEPEMKVLCHCNNCKKFSGSAFMANARYDPSKVRVTTGKEYVQTYGDAKTSSGNPVNRSFCRNCGSSLFLHSPYLGLFVVATGTLDGTQAVDDPQLEFFCRDRAAWVPEMSGTKRLDAIS